MRIVQNDKKLGFLKQNLSLKKKTLSFENDDIYTFADFTTDVVNMIMPRQKVINN